MRLAETELRTLTVQEKEDCKNCVQQLLASAKESISASSANMTTDASEQKEELSAAIIEQSHELLYSTVERMDKAVLVELSNALGGLVQSMYIERELAKQEETLRLQRERRTQELAMEKEREENHLAGLLRNWGPNVDMDQLLQLNQLPAEKLKLVTTGGVFLKVGRYSSTMRIYSMSADLNTLYWRDLTGKKSETTCSLEMKSFESVFWPDDQNNNQNNVNNKEGQQCELWLVGRTGCKSLRLRYVGALNEEGNKVHMVEWGQIMRFAIARSTANLS
mmetsp:Transcript_16879/g.24425  ORF Transcript_16879/g.24425 Transcript_16879/m.24425 type:complete len:278 (+) Transcript_16879:396-1229(+)